MGAGAAGGSGGAANSAAAAAHLMGQLNPIQQYMYQLQLAQHASMGSKKCKYSIAALI